MSGSSIISTVINGLYWMYRGQEWGGEIYQLAKDVNILAEKDQPLLKDHVRVACQVGTCVLDLYVLKKDWNAATLEKDIKVKDKDINKFRDELNKNKALSAQFQAMSLTTHIGHNVTNGHLINQNTLYRIFCLAKKNAQLPPEHQMEGATMATLKACAIVGVGSVALSYFDNWYELYGPNAPQIELDVDYEGIPEEHEDNPVFSQYLCPITQMPMRFPVTAPSVPGHPGHHFERKAIIDWLRRNKTNPMNQQPLRLNQLRENTAMREIIENELKRLKDLNAN